MFFITMSDCFRANVLYHHVRFIVLVITLSSERCLLLLLSSLIMIKFIDMASADTIMATGAET